MLNIQTDYELLDFLLGIFKVFNIFILVVRRVSANRKIHIILKGPLQTHKNTVIFNNYPFLKYFFLKKFK